MTTRTLEQKLEAIEKLRVEHDWNDHVILNEQMYNVPKAYEYVEQVQAHTFIRPHDRVLELGCRYGSVSCIINDILSDRTMHVAVDPDPNLHEIIKINRDRNGCEFHIFNGAISPRPERVKYLGYGTHLSTTGTKIETKTLDQIKGMYGIPSFTTLVADCEGALPQFIRDFPEILDEIDQLIYEQDGKCSYAGMLSQLSEHGFQRIDNPDNFHFVFRKS